MPDPAADEVRLLLTALGLDATAVGVRPRDDAARWAVSGAMHLTGAADGPPSVPAAPIASRLAGASAVLAHLSGVAVDGPALLGERAARRGLTRRGPVSAGGASRLLRTADGWAAVTLSRPDDWELVPAWLLGAAATWEAVATAAAGTGGAALAARGQELGLAVAVVPAAAATSTLPWALHAASGPPSDGPRRVVDLSALWAGPLCAQLLAATGAEVVTVDSVSRPDGARVGDPGLFSLLHEQTRSQSLDLRTTEGLAQLRSLIDDADVVITSARPRALHQLGLDPLAEVTARPGLTWIAVTGYGLTGPWRDRVAYGDDAAAAGGLVVGDPPVFCADAAADPATGLYAAIAATALTRSGGGVVDVALSAIAQHLARPPHRPSPPVVRLPDGWAVETAEGLVPVAVPRARS